jgi:hypothetical protein
MKNPPLRKNGLAGKRESQKAGNKETAAFPCGQGTFHYNPQREKVQARPAWVGKEASPAITASLPVKIMPAIHRASFDIPLCGCYHQK